MTAPPGRSAWRRGFVVGLGLAVLLWLATMVSLLGLGLLADRLWTGPLGDRAVTVLAILRTTQTPGAYTTVAEIDGRRAAAAFAARLPADRWAVLSEPVSRRGETVAIASTRVVDPSGRECLVIAFQRTDRIDVSACLSPVARP